MTSQQPEAASCCSADFLFLTSHLPKTCPVQGQETARVLKKQRKQGQWLNNMVLFQPCRLDLVLLSVHGININDPRIYLLHLHSIFGLNNHQIRVHVLRHFFQSIFWDHIWQQTQKTPISSQHHTIFKIKAPVLITLQNLQLAHFTVCLHLLTLVTDDAVGSQQLE